jgi:TolA-binding protein
MIPRLLILAAWLAVLGGCIETREELAEQQQKQVMQDQVNALQQTRAQEQVRQQEYDEQLRNLTSHLDQSDNLNKQLQAQLKANQDLLSHGFEDSSVKFHAFEQALLKMQAQITELSATVEELKKSNTPTRKEASAGAKSTLQLGDEAMENKDFKGAIVLYQKYRDKNPKGKKLAEATYKIGVCFKELGMKPEAKTFLEEVTDKYPSSAEAKKAKTILKALK